MPHLGLFTPWNEPVPFVYEGDWAPGPVWAGVENLASIGIRLPDRKAHSESLRLPTTLSSSHKNWML
jgi:hypothetical protein